MRENFKNKDDFYIAYQFAKHYGGKTAAATKYYYERIPSNK